MARLGPGGGGGAEGMLGGGRVRRLDREVGGAGRGVCRGLGGRRRLTWYGIVRLQLRVLGCRGMGSRVLGDEGLR